MRTSKKLLIFNMDESRLSLIRTFCGSQNVRIIRIYRPQYGETIGALAGIPIFKLTNQPYRDDDFSQEMMVMCGFTPDELDAFLKAYRDAGIPPVWLKATLTPHNMSWTAAQLYGELSQEHKQLHG